MEPNGIGGTEDWRRYLDDFVPSKSHRHESYAIRACRLAVDAVECGSYGVGAILLDAEGRVVVEGHNRVRAERFRSDLHAEMVVLNAYEALELPRERARDLTLVTSLEPCPMCVTRLIVAGVGTVLHISEDPAGGMVRTRRNLPPIFRTITEHQEQAWGSAECSEELRVAAFKIWIESRDRLSRNHGSWS
jgi:tRNA(adenine34) deaminase